MKISILVENSIGDSEYKKVCQAEWGLSFFIETNNENILFDSGHTELYIKNAKNMGIDLDKTNHVVLSHYHWDHAKGLLYHQFTNKKELIIHPDILKKIPKDDVNKYKSDFKVITSEKSYNINDNVIFLGEIPRIMDYEKGKYKDDNMLDDTAIAIKTINGVVVLAGCSHSGICNICEYAKKVTGEKLYAVMGGFHLTNNDVEAVKGTINYFKKESPKYLYPMHCVDFYTMAKFYNEFNIKKLGSGSVLKFEE